MKRLSWLSLCAAFFVLPTLARGEFLFNQFLEPSFVGDANAEYSRWNIFYSAHTYGNLPDEAAPFGSQTAASAVGATPPPNAIPSDPTAYWDSRNPTISQSNTTAFLAARPADGNIYSFAAATSFVLNDSTADSVAPHNVGTVVFQFQTDGSLMDFNSIKLVYNNGSGDIAISANEIIKEYRSSGSSFGGLTNRSALQWDLTGLNISTYKIVWSSSAPSMSLQDVLLDTTDAYAAAVPASRTWNAGGSGNWSAGSNWVQGSTSVANGNVRFTNAADATIALDGNRTIGEMIFDTASNVTLSPGASVLTANTGISTTAAATGTYTIGSSYAMGAFNVFDIRAGTVRLSGGVSGNYGFNKQGAGTLVLGGNNSFTGSVAIENGTLRMEGVNQYTGSTAVHGGNLVVAGNALNSQPGVLGNASSAIGLGADSIVTDFVGAPAAAFWINGDHTVARNIAVSAGNNAKTLGAFGTTAGATYSGEVNLGSYGALNLSAQNASDKVTFTGAITGGSNSQAVTVQGQGTVLFSGANKNYASNTVVSSGTLVVASGTSLMGNGAMTVNAGGHLRIDGTLGGLGALNLNGGTLTGSGTISKAFVADAGDVLSPGNSPGSLNTGTETWGGGAAYLWEIKDVDAGNGTGWDIINITGDLNITATAGNKFVLQITSLDALNAAGLIGDFNANANYSWQLVSVSGLITGFDASAFDLNASDFLNALNGNFSIADGPGGLYLQYTAVPEPGTWVLLASGLALILVFRGRLGAGNSKTSS